MKYRYALLNDDATPYAVYCSIRCAEDYDAVPMAALEWVDEKTLQPMTKCDMCGEVLVI